MSVADRMIALDLGRVVAEGSPRVVNDPTVVASYLGPDTSAFARSDALVAR
jgi:ABC-type branched-subunit amino acid transport system ATPase component